MAYASLTLAQTRGIRVLDAERTFSCSREDFSSLFTNVHFRALRSPADTTADTTCTEGSTADTSEHSTSIPFGGAAVRQRAPPFREVVLACAFFRRGAGSDPGLRGRFDPGATNGPELDGDAATLEAIRLTRDWPAVSS